MFKGLWKLIYNNIRILIITINLFFIGVKYTESIVKQNIILEENIETLKLSVKSLEDTVIIQKEIINLKNIKIERLQQ